MHFFLEQCLQSVVDASKEISSEIIVVDNNSHDASCDMISKKFPQVKLIANKENTGFSKANNQGVATAKGEFVLILNPDTVVAEDTFSKILSFAKTKQNIGILGVKLVDGHGSFLPESKRGIPTPKVSFNKLTGISSKQTGKYYATHIDPNENGVVEILVGAFMLIKRSIYNEVKGFDEDYFMYGEDIDLSYKVHKSGYQNYYFSNTQVIHYKGESTKKDVKYLKHFHGAMKIFYRKHFKLNKIYDFVMSFGIKFWYFMKLIKLKTRDDKISITKDFIYVGANQSLFAKLIGTLNPNLAVNHTAIDIDAILINKIDTVFFDNNSISNADIIAAIQTLNNNDISFRFIPKGCDFYIGSDSSYDRGIVQKIR